MLTIREAPVFVAPGCEYGAGTGFEGHEFFEASSIRKVGDTYYDEIPKELIMLVVEDKDVDKVLKVIVENARVDKNGTYGDGKIFVSDVERAITISSGKDEL